MGLVIANNLDLSAVATGYILPVKDGAQYWNFFNGEANITRNLVPGKPAATKVGSPVVNAQSVTLSNLANYINTNVAQTEEMTILTIGEVTAASGNFVHWSNYGSPITNGGTALTSVDFVRQSITTGNPTLNLAYSADNFATRSQLSYGVTSGADTVKLRAIAAAFSQSGMTTRLRDLTNNKSQVQATPAGGVLAKAGTILLGSHYTAVESSTGKLYMCAIYNRALSDAEINTAYAAVKSFYAGLDIIV